MNLTEDDDNEVTFVLSTRLTTFNQNENVKKIIKNIAYLYDL